MPTSFRKCKTAVCVLFMKSVTILTIEYKSLLQVNGRLQKQEEDGKDGDPAFPKQQWPPSHLCPLCHSPGSQVRLLP